MKYDFLVFIGRFQPFHNGHKAVIEEALTLSKKVIVLVGSANGPRSYRNPFTFSERSSMITRIFYDQRRIFVTPLLDMAYNDNAWIKRVQMSVQGIVAIEGGRPDSKIGLIGCNKDESSYYLKLFPKWGHEDVKSVDLINATDIRENYFRDKDYISLFIRNKISEVTEEFLMGFQKTLAFNNIQREYEFVKNYKKSWEKAPYEPIFVTTDAVVIQSGHILLIKRKAYPGQGLWALPGGFLKPSEKIEDGMIRELREETKIKVPDPVLRGSIKKQKVFDDPYRSSRGRTITHAFLLELQATTELPKIKGSDDAEKARWVPLNELKEDNLFEDHYAIIQNMIGNI